MRPIKQNEKFKLCTFQEKRRIMSGWSKRRVPLLTRKIRTRTATWTGLSSLSGSYLRTCLLMRTRPSTSLRYLSPSNYWIWIKAWISSLWHVYSLGARCWSYNPLLRQLMTTRMGLCPMMRYSTTTMCLLVLRLLTTAAPFMRSSRVVLTKCREKVK